MTNNDNLDHAALAAAKTHMGEFAWPTVIFGIAVFTCYLVTIALALAGILPLVAAVPLVALLTYAAYTVLHESVHGTISGSHPSLRWLNETLGYMAAWILMIPLTAHRHEHLAHHRHTNQRDEDPDFIVADMAKSALNALRVAPELLLSQPKYYLARRWAKGPRSQDLALCCEVFAALAPRFLICAMGFWLEGAALFVLAWFLGIMLTMFLFAYLVHTPHEAVGRYVDTSTILVDGPAGKVVTWLWLYQNYHSIHHLFPRVPFYRYPALFGQIEDIMVAKGAPIYHLGTTGMQFKQTGPLN